MELYTSASMKCCAFKDAGESKYADSVDVSKGYLICDDLLPQFKKPVFHVDYGQVLFITELNLPILVVFCIINRCVFPVIA